MRDSGYQLTAGKSHDTINKQHLEKPNMNTMARIWTLAGAIFRIGLRTL